MATSRPTSLIIPANDFEERNAKRVAKKRSEPQQERSSSSSVDSSSANHVNSHANHSSSQNLIRTATGSTTTDSDLESEQDEHNLSQARKSETNSQEQLSRRMKHFQKLFKSEIHGEIPELIDSYVCAYQGDILLQGKMYITDRYLCFHSRIISYVTKHVHRWEQIEDVTKERVAFIFPTAIGIQLKHSDKKLIYASFLQRDQAYDKISSVWSRAVNGVSSCDDDDSEMAHDGTLKATNHNHKGSGRQRDSYEVIDGPEQDEVLDMCLKDNRKRPRSVPSSKDTNGKLTSNHFCGKKPSEKNSLLHQKLSNESTVNTGQPRRHSRFSKREKKQNDTEKRNSSLVNNRTKSSALRHQQSQADERGTASIDQTGSHSNSSSTAILNRTVPMTNSNSRGPLTKLLNLIAPVINLTSQSFLSVVRLIQALPIRTTTCIFLFLILLFFHAFYLMKVASRIEHRLQSLHHSWPSSPSTKGSFSSSPKGL